ILSVCILLFLFKKEKEKFTSCPGFELNTATLLGSLLCLSINCATRHPYVDRTKIVTYVTALLTGVNCLHSWCVLYLYTIIICLSYFYGNFCLKIVSLSTVGSPSD